MPSADLIITNARLLTMNKVASRAESLAIAGNRILAVGSNADMKALKGSRTRVIDAHMNTVMPGMLADVIVLNGDIEATPADQMSTLKPMLTICDGRVTFEP